MLKHGDDEVDYEHERHNDKRLERASDNLIPLSRLSVVNPLRLIF